MINICDNMIAVLKINENGFETLQFEELLMDSDVRDYSKDSPFEAGERSKLDIVLIEDYFYEHLYAYS